MENKCMPSIVNQVISTSSSRQDTSAEYKKYRDISGMIKGTFPFYPEKVVGNSVDDIFTLTDQDVCNSLMEDMVEPIRISIRARKNGNSLQISFDIAVEELSNPLNPQCLNIRRNDDIGRWIKKNIRGLQCMSRAMEDYIGQAFETLMPILEKSAKPIYENDSLLIVYYNLIKGVSNCVDNSSSYRIRPITDKGTFACIKGKRAFDNLLTALELGYERKELLPRLKYLGLIISNGDREYSYQFKSLGWWYCIRCDMDLIKKAETMIKKTGGG